MNQPQIIIHRIFVPSGFIGNYAPLLPRRGLMSFSAVKRRRNEKFSKFFWAILPSTVLIIFCQTLSGAGDRKTISLCQYVTRTPLTRRRQNNAPEISCLCMFSVWIFVSTPLFHPPSMAHIARVCVFHNGPFSPGEFGPSLPTTLFPKNCG